MGKSYKNICNRNFLVTDFVTSVTVGRVRKNAKSYKVTSSK